MSKRLPNLCCCLTHHLAEKTKEGCYKAYFLEGFISATVSRMNRILDEQEAYIEKLEKRITIIENEKENSKK